MDHLNEACPNIEQLHIKRLDGSSFGKDEITVNFFTSIRFNCLKWLNIEVPNLFDGSYLLSVMFFYKSLRFYFVVTCIIFSSSFQQMVNNCPRLERLNLDGEVEGKAFFLYLIECLPSARNLRDLRYFSAISKF